MTGEKIMEDKIIDYINMYITAMTDEEEQGFRDFLHQLELESFASERSTKWDVTREMTATEAMIREWNK